MAYTKGRRLARKPPKVDDAVMHTRIKGYKRRLFGTRDILAHIRSKIAKSSTLSRTAVREFTQARRTRMSLMTLEKLAEVAGFEVHLRPKRKTKPASRRAAKKKGRRTRTRA